MAVPHEVDGVGAVGPMCDNCGSTQALAHNLEPGWRLEEIQDVLTERFSLCTTETKLLMGFCVSLSRDVLNEVGLLDEDLFLGNDDLELSWRLQTHGLKLLVAKDVFVHHVDHVSFKTVEPGAIHNFIVESSQALSSKLIAYYDGHPPSDQDLWGLSFRHV